MTENTNTLAPSYQTAIANTASHYELIISFVKSQMLPNIDFGKIPGTNSKPVLLKPGAEKLCRLFSLRPQFDLIQSVVNFDKPLFHYHYRCSLYRNGELTGQGDGNCNTLEQKYQKQKYRVYDLCNTVCKISQKRALVAAVLTCCGVSELFTQDLLEDECIEEE